MTVRNTARELATRVDVAIKKAFRDLDEWTPEQNQSSRHFTKQLNGALERLGKDLELDVRMSKKTPYENWEFLFDVCFLETGRRDVPGDGYFTTKYPLRRIILALESEWLPNVDEILYDFSKLLFVRANLRVLVFYQPDEDGVQAVLSRVRKAVDHYQDKRPDDAFLVCALVGRQINSTLLLGSGDSEIVPN